ncbi:MAG: NAD-dependent epimerase/dehydratase family protein, partial [Candidatus Dormibacteraeota bacterium]|nr:NAD-dependent epimerase/dehydratase family protein [Candidatus Dormibacteraeota bacterium]
MRLLVTGGTGFIGLRVLRRLVAEGDQVMAPVRDAAGADRVATLSADIRAPLASMEAVDQMQALVADFKPEAAINLAWYANPADYRTSIENLGSLQATLDLTHLLISSGCNRLVYSGSCFEYRVADGARGEDDATDPRSLYAATKLAAGAVCGALAEAAGREFAWARIYFPYGPGESPRRLLPMVARKLAKG